MARLLEIPVEKPVIIQPGLTELEFKDLCAANPDINIERTKEGEVVVNAREDHEAPAG